jgi:hypothetical protein
MSKPWKPNRPTVELHAPSRIRREPPPRPVDKQTAVDDPTDNETWAVVIGVLAFALAINFLIFWISDYTSGGNAEPTAIVAHQES